MMLLPLFFYKYGDFVLGNQFTGLYAAGLGLALPLGISFFTFKNISYAVDRMRGL